MEVAAMPWKETCVLDQRVKFIAEAIEQSLPFAALCRAYGISRETGYEYLRRYETEGPAGLHDHSRAPKTHPQGISSEVEEAILTMRAAHPTWGPIKLRQVLERTTPTLALPAKSTIGELLNRHGLCHRRTRRAHPHATPSAALTPPTEPNTVWCVDFKGWFKTADGRRCYPLTLTDANSRFLLRCQALPATDGALVHPILDAAFREFGLPEVIRSDNGTPFASTGLGGLSRLSLWWLKLGIRPERILPGRPDQNGRHERFHRTLKEDLRLATSPAANLRAQQQAFIAYRQEFNGIRPHAALGGLPPAHVFTPSPRRYTDRVPEFSYPSDCQERIVHLNGCLKWQGNEIFISEVLVGERVGIRPITMRHWALRVGPLTLAVRDVQDNRWLSKTDASRLLSLCEEEYLDD
jgi:transposase InsO family protein